MAAAAVRGAARPADPSACMKKCGIHFPHYDCNPSSREYVLIPYLLIQSLVLHLTHFLQP